MTKTRLQQASEPTGEQESFHTAPDHRLSRRTFVAGAGLVGATALAGCLGTDTADAGSLSGEIAIAGSSTVFPVSVAVAEEFRAEYPDVQVSVDSTGTGGGFGNFFCEGLTQINDASRPIQPEEEQQCADNGVTPIEFQVAIDALTVVVNAEADWVDCMTVDELRRVWEPNGAERWSDIRPEWPDEAFELYGAAPTSGTFDYLTEAIVGEEDSHREDYQATEQDNTIVTGVAGSQYAMGYFGYAYFSGNEDASIKAISVDDGAGCVAPSLETAKAGEYTPLSRPLFIYVSQESLSRPEMQEFVRFYLESSGTSLISDVGYVPMPEEDVQASLDRFESIVADLE
jgi:phosphate transport system substrate-binding protein